MKESTGLYLPYALIAVGVTLLITIIMFSMDVKSDIVKLQERDVMTWQWRADMSEDVKVIKRDILKLLLDMTRIEEKLSQRGSP